jgi:hypothetical protein
MRDRTTVVVCELGKPAYQAELSERQIEKLICDTFEFIHPTTLRAWGHDCPLPDSVIVIAGGNAAVKDTPPIPNRFGVLGTFVIAGPRGHSLRKNVIPTVIEIVQAYDNAALSLDFRIPPHAVPAQQWESRGNEWNPSAHLTGDISRGEEIKFINYLLAKFQQHVVAFYSYRPFPVMYSLELQFAASADGREQARAFVREYESAFDKRGSIKSDAVAAADAFFSDGQVQR